MRGCVCRVCMRAWCVCVCEDSSPLPLPLPTSDTLSNPEPAPKREFRFSCATVEKMHTSGSILVLRSDFAKRELFGLHTRRMVVSNIQGASLSDSQHTWLATCVRVRVCVSKDSIFPSFSATMTGGTAQCSTVALTLLLVAMGEVVNGYEEVVTRSVFFVCACTFSAMLRHSQRLAHMLAHHGGSYQRTFSAMLRHSQRLAHMLAHHVEALTTACAHAGLRTCWLTMVAHTNRISAHIASIVTRVLM
jgi:hypothetical protein